MHDGDMFKLFFLHYTITAQYKCMYANTDVLRYKCGYTLGYSQSTITGIDPTKVVLSMVSVLLHQTHTLSINVYSGCLRSKMFEIQHCIQKQTSCYNQKEKCI